MNALTFDIEEWAWAKAEGFGTPEKYREYDVYLNHILNVLDEQGVQATFFCTGLMAVDFPQVVKLIQSRGHDIGCHSYRHTWMNKMTETEAREDTHAAVAAIEQCIGVKVKSYRAPAFSIDESNKWMFEILAENGIECDASIFPAVRDFGGFANFGKKEPCIIKYKGIEMKEFPICTSRIIGKEIAFSGGGYFRFFPLWFVMNQMRKNNYNMFYFHIGDIIPETLGFMTKQEYESYFKEKGTFKARCVRYVKSNLGKKTTFKKVVKLINSTKFVGLKEMEKTLDWSKLTVVDINK